MGQLFAYNNGLLMTGFPVNYDGGQKIKLPNGGSIRVITPPSGRKDTTFAIYSADGQPTFTRTIGELVGQNPVNRINEIGNVGVFSDGTVDASFRRSSDSLTTLLDEIGIKLDNNGSRIARFNYKTGEIINVK